MNSRISTPRSGHVSSRVVYSFGVPGSLLTSTTLPADVKSFPSASISNAPAVKFTCGVEKCTGTDVPG